MNTSILLILLVPIVEIYLFIKIGSQIGAFNTISLILITAVIGLYYAKYEGLNTLRSAVSQLVKNELPIACVGEPTPKGPGMPSKALL